MKRNNKFFSMLYVVLCLAFFYLPILVTMIFSFNSSKSLTRFTGFSLRWYQELLGNGEVIKAVYVSVTIAIIATIVSTILGTITAIGLSKSKKVIKELLLNINNIPILNPEIVTAISLMLLFSSLGFRKGYLTMLLAHIAFCTPYVITSVYPKVRALDPNMANAAMDLGATPFQALTKVIVPMIKEGIFAGALLAFTMSFDDFVISYFVSGNGVKNISIVVYNMTKRINPTINALSTIVIVVIIVVLLFANLLPKFKNKARKLNRKAVKIVSAVLVVAVTAGLIKWGFVAQSTHVLKVYNAGEYMDLSLLEDFEKEYDCTIVYETFESNEMMYTKLSSGETYDVLIPSDYMIERLIKEEYLQALDWKEIPNKKNLLNDVMNQSYDPGNRYSCPYFWGTVGILYNKTMVDDPVDSWGILWNEKYKDSILMQDSVRDAFGITLKYLGYSLNSTDLDELTEAKNKLIEQKPLVQAYVVDQARDKMIGNEAALAVIYSGEAITCQLENPDLEYVIPKEGSNMWIDSWVIPKNAKNKENAEAFINFMCRPDIAKMNFDYITYSIPNEEGRKLLDPEYRNNPIVFPDDKALENCETFKFLGDENDAIYNELWRQVKSK